MDEKVALVTGGTGSIGREIVNSLSDKKVKVIFTYKNNKTLAKQLEGENVSSINLDLENESSILECVREIKKKYGRLDFLINNSGIISDSFLENMPNENLKKVINVNLVGTMILTKECIGLLKESNGRIVNIVSVSGEAGHMGQSAYSSSKAGIIGFTKSLAKEMAQYGVTVNAVSPGFIDSRLVDELGKEFKEKVIKFIPLKKIGNPKCVSELVYFLINNEENYITGQVIRIDGGLYI